MNRVIYWLKNVGIRQILTVFLAATTFLVVPAFSHSQALQAQAARADVYSESKPVDDATIKRIQEKAEDLGDRPERPIGKTGLKNIRKLGENIPETVELKARQTGAIANPNQPDKKAGLEKAQKAAERD